MNKAISEIIVLEENRIRKDLGDIIALETSIGKVGLLNPILIDERNRLLAGYRRLTACRNLGWQEIEVKVIYTDSDAMKMLDIEVDENLFRQDFSLEEILAIEKRRAAILLEARGTFWQRCKRWLKRVFLGKTE